jgi:hypothetical protein
MRTLEANLSTICQRMRAQFDLQEWYMSFTNSLGANEIFVRRAADEASHWQPLPRVSLKWHSVELSF